MSTARAKGAQRAVLVLLVVAVAALGAWSCREREEGTGAPEAIADEAAEPIVVGERPDEDVRWAVERGLLVDGAVPSQRIDVAVEEGVVTLTGQIDNLLAKRWAAERAEAIRGVRAVVDRLEVTAPSRPDLELAADVMNALAYDATTNAYQVRAAATGGSVTLTGEVGSQGERQLAESVTAGVRGVREVVDELSVRPAQGRSDAEILSDIERGLTWDRWIDADDIDVVVRDGAVTLSGSVGSAAAKSRARQRACVAGVRSIEDGGLEVTPWAEVPETVSRGERPTLEDDAIERAVAAALEHDPRVAAFEPGVSVSDGAATLTGRVSSAAARRAAVEDARSIAGVWRVRSLLRVRPAQTPTDQEIQLRVTSLLGSSPYVDRHQIAAAVSNGRVALYGTVDTAFERAEAERLASTALGVADVESYLAIRDGGTALPPEDWVLREDVEDQIFWDPWTVPRAVTVEVDRGTVTLAGTVPSWEAYSAAARSAREAGALRVVNRLRIAGSGPDALAAGEGARQETSEMPGRP